jgi:hypothetical protein
MVSRIPPKSITQYLRKEVNFGCPVQVCGNPYLTWHHFDPTWKDKEHHNADGMIALCTKHAPLADGGRWTKEQLREMKQKPYVTESKIEEFYGYQRKDVVCMIGNIAFDVSNVLEIDGERVTRFEKDSNGYNTLNILIRDFDGSIILQMENNFWTAYTEHLFDLVCPAQGKELTIISKDKRTNFEIRFDDYSRLAFGSLLYDNGFTSNNIMDFISQIGAPTTIPVCTITGNLAWRNYHLRISTSALIEMNNGITIKGSFVTGRDNAVTLQHGKILYG